jgi:hypothetical protein
VGACLGISQDHQAVSQADSTEVINLLSDNRRQTDAAVAGRSEGNQERLAGNRSLGYVVICHLASNKSPHLAAQTEDEELSRVGQPGRGQESPLSPHAEGLEQKASPRNPGPASINHGGRL